MGPWTHYIEDLNFSKRRKSAVSICNTWPRVTLTEKGLVLVFMSIYCCVCDIQTVLFLTEFGAGEG